MHSVRKTASGNAYPVYFVLFGVYRRLLKMANGERNLFFLCVSAVICGYMVFLNLKDAVRERTA